MSFAVHRSVRRKYPSDINSIPHLGPFCRSNCTKYVRSSAARHCGEKVGSLAEVQGIPAVPHLANHLCAKDPSLKRRQPPSTYRQLPRNIQDHPGTLHCASPRGLSWDLLANRPEGRTPMVMQARKPGMVLYATDCNGSLLANHVGIFGPS